MENFDKDDQFSEFSDIEEENNDEEINSLIKEKEKIIDTITCISPQLKNQIKNYITYLKEIKNITTRNETKSIFSVIYSYCVTNDIRHNPKLLAEELKLTKNDVTTILREISHTSKKKKSIHKVPVNIMSCDNFISFFVSKKNIEEEDVPFLIFAINKLDRTLHPKKLELLINGNPCVYLAWIISNFLKKNSQNGNFFTAVNQNKVEELLKGYIFEGETPLDLDKLVEETKEEFKNI
jgi:hypothetical protein